MINNDWYEWAVNKVQDNMSQLSSDNLSNSMEGYLDELTTELIDVFGISLDTILGVGGDWQ